MSQLIYSILALLLIMFLSMNMQRGVGRDQQEQSLNEVTTQLAGVGTEVLERIGRTHFDRYAIVNRYDEARFCGRVGNGQEAQFNTDTAPTCSSYFDANCDYMEGFDNIPAFTLTRGEFDYRVDSVNVEFVNPDDPAGPATGPSFARRVTVHVSNPYLYVGDDITNTFSLTMDRVFVYGCATGASYIPQPRQNECCPGDPGGINSASGEACTAPLAPTYFCSISP